MARRLDDVSSLRRAFGDSIRPAPNVTISEWADRFRMLTSSQSANPGMWRTDKVEYLRDIMDACSPLNPRKRIVVQKSRRAGFTEGVINNTVGAFIHMAPCPILVGQPTENDAEEWSKDSLDPMIETTPVLRGLFSSDASRRKGNTILHKRSRNGAVIYGRSASTAKSFRRILARLVALDEIDAYLTNVDGEGSSTKLAEGRADTFTHNKKIVLGSTPTVMGHSPIETEYLGSTMGRYHVPCPDCRFLQRLVWEQVVWTDDDPRTAEYACVNCGSCIPHRQKRWMLKRANGARWIHEYPERETLGFQFSALYSPWVSWEQLVREWLEAKGDPTKEQVFRNQSLGETWDLANGEKWDEEGFRALLMQLEEVPATAAVLTAAVDVQHDRLVLQVDAWGAGEERWTVERRDLLGDTSGPAVWSELAVALRYRYPLDGGGTAMIRATAVDCGDLYTQQGWNFCMRHKNWNVWGIKGNPDTTARVWPREKKFRNKGGYSPIMIGVSAAKEIIHARLRRSIEVALEELKKPPPMRKPLGGPTQWHLSDQLTESYFEELTAEVQVVEYSRAKSGGASKPRKKWMLRESGRKNEALDVSVYSYAVLQGLLASRTVHLDAPLVGRAAAPSSRKKEERLEAHPSTIDSAGIAPSSRKKDERLEAHPTRSPSVARSPRRERPIAPRYLTPR